MLQLAQSLAFHSQSLLVRFRPPASWEDYLCLSVVLQVVSHWEVSVDCRGLDIAGDDSSVQSLQAWQGTIQQARFQSCSQ